MEFEQRIDLLMQFSACEKRKKDITLLWKIAQEVVKKYECHEDASVDIYCVFCGADNYLNNYKDLEHEASCIVLKARALVAQNS